MTETYEAPITGPQFPPDGFEQIDVFGVAKIAPAAGKEVAITVPFGRLWRVVAMTAKLTASSVAANRYLGFDVSQQDGTVVYTYRVTSALTASQSITVTFSEDIATETTVGTTDTLLMPKPSAWFPPGWTFGTGTTNIDIGDQWSDVTLWVHSWQPC